MTRTKIAEEEIQHKIDFKTKPVGALGKLEKIALQVCKVQNTLSPVLHKPTILVFAADHGLAQAGVSAYPPEVTAQMVLNFVGDGAAINVFTKQHGINLKVIDAGVNFTYDAALPIAHLKVAMGTKNMLQAPAMSAEELSICLQKGSALVAEQVKAGSNVIGFGEMGIGNTSSAALLMHTILELPLAQCVGRGTGLNNEQLAKKIAVLNQVLAKHPNVLGIQEALQTFGGFEIAMMCGAMLEAVRQKMLVLVDGFIATAAFACAQAMNEEAAAYALFCHQSDESGHKLMLQTLGVEPILNLDLRLGEGTGCALAYPIIKSAVEFMNTMASFETAGVSNKD